MGNKFSNKCIWVLMLVLGVFVVAVTALIGGNSSIRNAQQTAQRTLQYLQNQCIRTAPTRSWRGTLSVSA